MRGREKVLYDSAVVTKEDVARTLKRLRGSRTQAQCAQEAGVSPNAWSHYEKGRRMPTADTQAKLAKGVGVTLARFEEELFQSRGERLRAKTEKARPDEATRGPDNDPYQRALREGLENIHREFEKLFLLRRDPS